MVEAKTGLHLGVELGGTGCKIAVYRETGNEDEPLEKVFLQKLETSQTDANVTCQELVKAGKQFI